MKRLLILMLCLLFLLPQYGCIRSNTADQNGYVLAIGFDPGNTLRYRFSFAVQKINMDSAQPSTDGFSILTAEGDTLFQAIETASSSSPYRLSFVRTTMLLFDQTLLEKDGTLSELLNSAMEQLLIRYNADVLVALDGAQAVLEGLSAKENKQSIDKLQEHFLSFAKSAGQIPTVSVLQLYQAIREKHVDVALPLIGTSEGLRKLGTGDSVGSTAYAYLGGRMETDTILESGVAGSAVLRGDRMIGVLDGQNTQLLLMLRGTYEEGGWQFSFPNGANAGYVLLQPKGKPKIDVQLSDAPTVAVRLAFSADLLHPENLETLSYEELEIHLESLLTDRLLSVFTACRDLGSDVFLFGTHAVRQFTSVSAWETFDWDSAYRNLQPRFSVEVNLINLERKQLYK